jgi:hypothetical protein
MSTTSMPLPKAKKNILKVAPSSRTIFLTDVEPGHTSGSRDMMIQT